MNVLNTHKKVIIMTLSFIFVMDIIGTIAFSVSGSLVAIRKNMDVFGVNILALTTAAGGGVVRDVILGVTPPVLFRTPVYALVSISTANLVFALIYFNHHKVSEFFTHIYEIIFFWFDSFGLAAFTVGGVNAAISAYPEMNVFLTVFMGMITGVGGGVMRDVMANQLPLIFVKHIYACASLAGALVAVLLWSTSEKLAVVCGFAVTILVRVVAAHYKLNLPRIKHK